MNFHGRLTKQESLHGMLELHKVKGETVGHLVYGIIALLEFIAYLLIDPFHVNPGWHAASEKKQVRMKRLRTLGYAIFVCGLAAWILPGIFAGIIAL